MNRYQKSALNREKGPLLNKEWGVGAVQARYRETGDWYIRLTRFPAALFDANGYVLFGTETEYKTSSYLQIGKQISVPNGISTMPNYVRVVGANASSISDLDIHNSAATEGRQRLVMHLQRERNQALVRNKIKSVASPACEICGFLFSHLYGNEIGDYCEVHHLIPLSEVEHVTLTRLKDLSILCANCHRVVHLRNPPYTLDEVRNMIAKQKGLKSS